MYKAYIHVLRLSQRHFAIDTSIRSFQFSVFLLFIFFFCCFLSHPFNLYILRCGLFCSLSLSQLEAESFINVFRSCCRIDGLLLLRALEHFSFLLFFPFQKYLYYNDNNNILIIYCYDIYMCVCSCCFYPVWIVQAFVREHIALCLVSRLRLRHVKQFAHINYNTCERDCLSLPSLMIVLLLLLPLFYMIPYFFLAHRNLTLYIYIIYICSYKIIHIFITHGDAAMI